MCLILDLVIMRVGLGQIFLISPILIAILVLIWLLFIYRSSTECTYSFYTLMSLSNLTRLHDSRDFTTASLELNSLLAICFSLLCVCWQSFNMNFANWDFFNSGSSGMIAVGRKTTKLDQTKYQGAKKQKQPLSIITGCWTLTAGWGHF